MSLKNLAFADSNVSLCPNRTQRDHRRRTFNWRGSSDVAFNDVVLPFIDEYSPQRRQPEPIHEDDYEIALVPRGNRGSGTGAVPHVSSTMDRVLLLPLTWRELLDRVRTMLSNANTENQRASTMRFGEVNVDFSTLEITRSARPIALTAQEFRLLRFFTQRPKQVISRHELLYEVWGYKDYPSTRTVDNHVCMLRQKLELNPARPIHFLTVHRMGYKFIP
jgi:DNA-binding winged helix-turn-helix (wHTH) protein